MRNSAAVALLLALTAAAPPKKLTPTDAVNAAPAGAWRTIPAEDLLVMTLDGGARVIIQLAPAFAPVHVANIRKFAAANYWQGAAVYRVQDNYVAQWGINEAKRALSAGAALTASVGVIFFGGAAAATASSIRGKASFIVGLSTVFALTLAMPAQAGIPFHLTWSSA